MTNRKLDNRVNKINELQKELETIQAEIDSIKDEIKSAMTEMNVDEVETDNYTIRWKLVTSTRLDTSALKKALPDVFGLYSKTSESKRFTIN